MVNILKEQTLTPLQIRQELDTLVRQDIPGLAGGERDEDPLAVDGATDSQDGRAETAVVVTYSWQDLDLGHGFHETAQGLRYTISEPARREVLTRLLQLNHQRYTEEQEQAVTGDKEKSIQRDKEKKGAKGIKGPKKNDGQLSMF